MAALANENAWLIGAFQGSTPVMSWEFGIKDGCIKSGAGEVNDAQGRIFLQRSHFLADSERFRIDRNHLTGIILSRGEARFEMRCLRIG